MKIRRLGEIMSSKKNREIKQKNLTKSHLDESIEVADNAEKLSWWQKFLPPCILTFFTILIYAPSLNYPFNFDDIANITKRFAIRYEDHLSRWWKHSRWFGDWLNSLNFRYARFDPFYYRIINIMIHTLTGILVFFLFLHLCRFLKKKPFFYNNAILIATVTSAFFLLHPVQTQTVSYVTQARVEGIASLFVIATIFLFVQALRAKNIWIKIFYFTIFLIAGILSAGTKEIVVVVPFLLVLIDWFFVSQEQWKIFKPKLFLYFFIGIIFLLVMIHYLGFDFLLNSLKFKHTVYNNSGNILSTNQSNFIGAQEFFISQFKVLLHYLVIFIFPFGLSVEYDWRLTSHFLAFDCILPLTALIIILGSVIYNIVQKKYFFLSFGLLWFFLSLAPRTTIIPSAELVCDYKTYLASVGIYFIFAVGITHFLRFFCKRQATFSSLFFILMSSKNVYFLMFFIFMIPVSIGTIIRNRVWSSSLAFWEDCVKKAPKKARTHNNYGNALSDAGRFDEAIEEYKRAIEMDKYYQDPLSNIAVAYTMKQDLDKAIKYLKLAIFIHPNYAEAHNNLGSLYIKKENYEEAERVLKKAVVVRPYYGKAYYNLARLAEKRNQQNEVWNYLKKASEGDLDIPEVFFKLGKSSLQLQRYDSAEDAFKKVIDRGAGSNEVWFNLANTYFMQKKFDSAQLIYERLLKDNPKNSQFMYNLAETFFSKKKYEMALELFKSHTQLPNPLPHSFFRAAVCLERMKKMDEAKIYLHDLLSIDAPNNFKKLVKNEITRMTLQSKLEEGKGTIKLSDLKKVVSERDVVA
jgi:protein O-mannosyl-transferase